MPSKVIHLTFEVAPFSKAGGMADFVGSLPVYLNRHGMENWIICPYHEQIMNIDQHLLKRLGSGSIDMKGKQKDFEFFQHEHRGTKLLLIRNAYYFDRPGLYSGNAGASTYEDNIERAVFFSKAVLNALTQVNFPIQHVFTHGWYGIPFLYYLRKSGNQNAVFYHMLHDSFMYIGPIPEKDFHWVSEIFEDYPELQGKNFYQYMHCLGVALASKIITVSPSTRQDLLDASMVSQAPESVLALRKPSEFFGFLNGIDTEIWSETKNDTFETLIARKKTARTQFLKSCPHLDEKRPVVLMMCRLAPTKGVYRFVTDQGDLNQESLPHLTRLLSGINLIICGNPGPDEGHINQGFLKLAAHFPNQIVYFNRYSDERAKELLLSSDMLLLPSVSEAGSLTLMFAMTYGVVPVASPAGGIKDIIRNEKDHPENGNGWIWQEAPVTHMREVMIRNLFGDRFAPQFQSEIVWPTVNDSMTDTFAKATKLYHDQSKWLAIAKRCFKTDHSWEKRCLPYVELIRSQDLAFRKTG